MRFTLPYLRNYFMFSHCALDLPPKAVGASEVAQVPRRKSCA